MSQLEATETGDNGEFERVHAISRTRFLRSIGAIGSVEAPSPRPPDMPIEAPKPNR